MNTWSTLKDCEWPTFAPIFQTISTPQQFTYKKHRSMENTISLALYSVQDHLDNKNSYVRMLFIDYNMAINTRIPNKVILKLLDLSFGFWISWLADLSQLKLVITFLLPRPSTLVPLGLCVQYLVLLYTDEYVAICNANSIFKFTDDTTAVSRIYNMTKCRKEIENLMSWCLDTKNTGCCPKQIKKWGGEHNPGFINSCWLTASSS